MSKLPINERLITVAGGALLLCLVLSAWLPRSCSLLRKRLDSCPRVAIALPPTLAQKEVDRYSHQNIAANVAVFHIKPDIGDTKTATVRFAYQGSLTSLTSYIQIEKQGALQNLALISHPLLSNITWPSTSEDGYRLYIDDGGNPISITHLLASLPPATTLAADSVAAQHFGLSSGSYISLDDLASLKGIRYVLTSYSPPIPDGTWLQFDHRVDISNATVGSDGTYEWAINVPGNGTTSHPSYLITTVHIDYNTAN